MQKGIESQDAMWLKTKLSTGQFIVNQAASAGIEVRIVTRLGIKQWGRITRVYGS